jgi:3-hydroxyacyl-[acyl-carrier-protein] dehydratase
VNANISVPYSAAFFEGHFPGQPILPGVAQLVLLLETLARETRYPVPLRRIVHVRLRQLVLPGDCLELAARELDGGRLRFDLKRAAVMVANGELVFGLPQEVAPGPPNEADAARPYEAPPLDDLIPHRAPMQFVTSILHETENGLTCEARIPAACALVRNDSVPALVALEAAAQSAAVWEALRRWHEGGAGGPRVGYLVALRDIALFTERIPADQTFVTCVHLEAAALPLSYYKVAVSSRTKQILRGTIVTFLTDDETVEKSRGAGG